MRTIVPDVSDTVFQCDFVLMTNLLQGISPPIESKTFKLKWDIYNRIEPAQNLMEKVYEIS
jgi:hypothetical protein